MLESSVPQFTPFNDQKELQVAGGGIKENKKENTWIRQQHVIGKDCAKGCVRIQCILREGTCFFSVSFHLGQRALLWH